MKKSIFVLLASFCIALFFAMNVSINLSKDQSKIGLALQNIEALADGETPGEGGSFPTPSAANDQKYAYRSGHYDSLGKYIRIKRQNEYWCIGQDHYTPDRNEYVYKCE